MDAGQKLGFVYMLVCDECAGGGGMCNEIDLVVLCVQWVLRCLSQMLCQRKDKLSVLFSVLARNFLQSVGIAWLVAMLAQR